MLNGKKGHSSDVDNQNLEHCTWTISKSSKWKHAVHKNIYNDRAKRLSAFLKS